MNSTFIVDDDADMPAAPILTGWETVVFELMDEDESDLLGLEELMVARYFGSSPF
jgi:hypothetical protein